MTLSSQYLEELSRRYKKQVEELQQSFAKTLQIVEEQNKKNSEREHSLQKQIQILQEDIEQLTDRIFSWTNICFYICCFAFIQISVVWIILKIYTQRDQVVYETSDAGIDYRRIERSCRNGFPRRNSLDGKNSAISLKKRRPSEEALNISGTYKELLILEDSDANIEEYDSFGETNKRKAKQKNRKSATRRTASAAEQSEFRKRMLSRYDSAPGEYEMSKDISSSNSCSDEHPPLDENYDIYLPGSDPYNEFIPDESSPGVDNLTPMVNGSAGTNSNADKTQTKIRRLSSPAFLKSPFSRSQRKKPHETTTGWEWHRLKRDPTNKDPSQIKNNKKSKSESPEVKVNGSISSKDSKDSLKTSASFTSSDKKQGSFRRMFKKVF